MKLRVGQGFRDQYLGCRVLLWLLSWWRIIIIIMDTRGCRRRNARHDGRFHRWKPFVTYIVYRNHRGGGGGRITTTTRVVEIMLLLLLLSLSQLIVHVIETLYHDRDGEIHLIHNGTTTTTIMVRGMVVVVGGFQFYHTMVVVVLVVSRNNIVVGG